MTTIINVRGTSGSGKSTLTRAVMAAYPQKSRVMVEGRKQPIGYVLNRPVGRPLYVVGHYETACGGCDTIASLDTIYDHVEKARSRGMDVFFEGLLLSSEFNRTLALAQRAKEAGDTFVVLGLDLPLQECLDSVNARRRAKRGDDAPGVNPKNTESKWKATRSVIAKLEAQGVVCEWHTRQTAADRALELLGHA